MKDIFSEQLKKLEEREKQIRNQRIEILNRKRKSEKSLENRKKIVLGSVLMKLAETDTTMRKAIIKCVHSMNSKDAELYSSYFEDANKSTSVEEVKPQVNNAPENKGE